MKNKIITSLLFVSAFVCAFAQDNKPGQGAIGFHYGVNFNGGVQQFIGVSGVLNNHWELGGALSFSYNHSNTSTEVNSTVEGNSGVLNATSAEGIRSTSYSVGINPYLLYHFKINSNLDLYAGPVIGIGFSNTNTHEYTTTTAPNYLTKDDELKSQPASVNLSVGGVLGCQYFFYKNLALGVQAGLNIGYSFAKGNNVDIVTLTSSGSDNPAQGTNSVSHDDTRANNHNFNLSTMASGGVSLAFYFSRTAKKQE